MKRIIGRYTKEQALAHLAEFKKSGLSKTAFCKKAGVGLATLYRWDKKHRNECKVGGRFVEAKIVSSRPPETPSNLVVTFGNIKIGIPVGVDLKWVQELLRGLS